MVITDSKTEVESQLDGGSEDRLCSICSEPIPLNRLKAMPHSTECVYCLELNGDIDLLKRYDDPIGRHGDIEEVQIYYKGPHPYIDPMITRRRDMGRVFEQSTWEVVQDK